MVAGCGGGQRSPKNLALGELISAANLAERSQSISVCRKLDSSLAASAPESTFFSRQGERIATFASESSTCRAQRSAQSSLKQQQRRQRQRQSSR